MTARRVKEVGALIEHTVLRYNDGATCSCSATSGNADPVEWANEHIATNYVSWWRKHPDLHQRGCVCPAHS